MVSQSVEANIVAINPDSLEHQLAASLRALREMAAQCGDDDYYEAKARAMLEHRPLVLLAVALSDQTMTWLMEPGHDGVVEAHARQGSDADGAPRDLATAQIGIKTHLLETIMGHVSWLVKEQTGQSLDEIGAFRNR